MSYSNPKLDYYSNIPGFYEALTAESLHHYEKSWLVNLANASALIKDQMPELNWAGFYLWNGQKLKLGPFQGKPACLEIQLGRGVCGTSALRKEAVLVPDVHLFPGHISCDSASQSEVVLPLLGPQGNLLAVLDLDSPILNRFSWTDVTGLQKFVQALVSHTDWRDLRKF